MGRRLTGAPRPTAAAGKRPAPWTPRGTVLVTGGTGGIGGQVGRWLADQGADRVVLSSRSGARVPGIAGLAADLATTGSTVDVVACDLARRSQIGAVLDRVALDGPPLTAVVHCAGVGEGTAIVDFSLARLDAVTGAKSAGALWLDELTADLPLEAFVLFSSASATWGSGLQPGYGAANAYLDALAENRRARGLPATSVAWGLWGGGGMADGTAGEQLQRYGLRLMDPGLGIKALAGAVDSGETTVTVADVDWDRFTPTFTVHRPSPLLSSLPQARRALAAAEAAEAAPPSESQSALEQRLAGLSRAEQDRALTDLVRREAAAVLGYPSPEAVETNRALRDLGADSVTAVELRNRLNAATGLRLSSTLVFDHPTSAALAEHLRTLIIPDEAGAGAPVFGGLEQLETLLAAIPADSDIRADVTVRLQTVLSKWMSAQDAPKREAIAGRLDSANADEVLDFITKEFGLS